MRASNLCTFLSAILLIFLSFLALLINFYFYKFPGNNYFPTNTLVIGMLLMLMYCGFSLQYGRTANITIMLQNVVYFFLMMATLALATNAAQFTPFSPIDHQLVAFESYFNINMERIIAWTHSHWWLTRIFEVAYDTLPWQICFLPLLIIFFKRYDLAHEYFFLMLFSGLIGFTFYYFFPTTGPASIINSIYFSEYQRATGLKFNQIHHYISPDTIAGGMIAMPSFHVIWAWFCVYLLRSWTLAWGLLLFINLVLIISCVMLGWHYPIDVVGSAVIILAAHKTYRACQRQRLKN